MTDFTKAISILSALSEGELIGLNSAVIDELKARRSRDARMKRSILREGDRVSWSGRKGSYEGRIVRVKRKKAIVRVGVVNWDVPLNMLKHTDLVSCKSGADEV